VDGQRYHGCPGTRHQHDRIQHFDEDF